MKLYTHFGPKNLHFIDHDGKKHETPDFVKRAAKNYRYDHERELLQKKCIACGDYYNVQVFEHGEFVDIHDEMEIHYYSEKSGYAIRCVSCNSKSTTQKINQDSSDKITNEYLMLNQVNLIYIKFVAVLEGKTDQECLNDIIDIIRKYNTLEYKYNKNIE
jgi:hypothetical protein